MGLSGIISKIAAREEIIANPPVLIDIGASEKLNPMWKPIAGISICIAFDADTRDFEYIESNKFGFKKQYVFNRIVVASSDKPKQTFYLTNDPYCSSLLPPDTESMKEFHFSDKFAIKQKIELEVIELKNVLGQLGINRVDWFKTDTQGTDLRLYKSLGEPLQDKVLALEFEPGFMDAYIGEDKILDVLNYMDKKPFILVDFLTKGALRMPKAAFDHTFSSNFGKRFADRVYKKAPGWAEITYLNKLENSDFTTREYILAWVFATVQGHHDLAFVYADKGSKKFNDPLFNELNRFSQKKLKKNLYSFDSWFRLADLLIRKHILKTA
ncbi:MAG: hypothetical protein WAQ28_02405 [Bacteroidia bacterium]|jgi:hypothetical protein